MTKELTREQVLSAQENKGKVQTEARLSPLFEKPDLLQRIWRTIDHDHKLDNKEKLALFIIAASSELPDPNDHVSAALKGDSSAGKDSAIKAVLKHFPEEETFFLTRGTAAALEDEAEEVKRIAFSEINKNRENGANKEITETFKQLAEGGTDVLKKDAYTGYRTTKRVKSSQKTLIYGTTEAESDEELETRYVIIPIKGYAKKNKVVVDDALDKAADYDYQINKQNNNSWIATSIKALDKELIPIIPFSHVLKEPIKDGDKEQYFFDYTKERVKRDAKRLLSLTKAITWLHQKQRCVKEYKGKRFVVAEPTDFITAVVLFAEFFNLTYSGIDYRIQKTLDTIRKLEGKHDAEIMTLGFPQEYYGYVLRHKLQEELGIQSLTTIKKYLSQLRDLGYIRDEFYDPNISQKGYLIRSEAINQGITRVSLPVTLIALIGTLTGCLTPENITKWYWNREISTINLDFLENECKFSQNDRYQLDSVNSEGDTHSREPKITAQKISLEE